MLTQLQVVEALCCALSPHHFLAFRLHSFTTSPLSKTIRFNVLEVVSHAGGKKKAFDKF